MTHANRKSGQARPLAARSAALLGALLALALLAAAPASAAYEQAGTFAGSATPVAEEKFAEEVQLGGVGGMAVNVTGAGGVEPGTVYAATLKEGGEGTRIAMFYPTPEGGLEFVEGWKVTSEEEEYERCGPPGELPDGETVHPNCSPQPPGGAGAVDVEVDQASGNVYVLNLENYQVGSKLVTVYSPDGGEAITRFGERAPGPESVVESPEKVHYSPYPGGLAVGGEGEVYVFDNPQPYRRLMVFKPQSPGDYAHYVYAGEVAAGGSGSATFPAAPVTDDAGNIYVGGGTEGPNIKMLAPETPSAYPAPPAAPPVCSFEFPQSGITSMTVNPVNGEVFFYAFKNPKRIHRLSPCDPETGKFTETESFKATPERGDLWGLAFDPGRQLPSRPAGVLYAGAQGGIPNSGVGKGEPGQSSLGYIFSRAKEIAPVVGSELASRVSTTTAKLEAQIDPKGFGTHYAFQYMTEAAFKEAGESFAGAGEAPLGGADLASGQGAVASSVAVSGLLPGTAYRYRALATSHCSVEDPEKVCEGTGAPEAFRTFAAEAPGLADKRAWELVSPAQKHGGQVLPADPSIRSCPDVECKPGGLYTRFPIQVAPGGDAIAYEGTPFAPGEGAVIENQYVSRRDGAKGWQTTNPTPALLRSNGGRGYKTFDTELSEGLLEQRSPTLSPEAPAEYDNLYRQSLASPLALSPLLAAEPPSRPALGEGSFALHYAGASADLSRIFFEANDALTEETPFAPEAVDGGAKKNNLYEWSGGHLALVNVLPGNAETVPGAGFANASAHAISADGSRAFWSDEAGHVYVREGAESTRAIPDPGKFLSAAADGSEVLLGNGHLYDLEAETITDLTEGEGGFQGILGQSDDLSRIYFADTAVLDKTPNGRGEEALEGKFNLYAWQGGTSRFVVRLTAKDNENGLINSSDWSSAPSGRTAEASPGGRFLAFQSQAPFTGYDNTGPCETDHAGGYVNAPCPEAFLYDSATGELTCASCNLTGTRPLGWSVLRAGGVGSQPRYLTDEGRLFFDSEDSLSPFDTNEGVEDVYEYEPEGVRSCKRAAGCVTLVSAGHEAVDSNFFAMSEGGRDAFFTTRDQLALKDRDDLIDLYDAREGGGIPDETEVARSECQGEVCQAAVSPPNDPTPGSSSFEGAGNVDEKKTAKKHKKKKHAHKKKASKRSHKRAASNNRGGAK